MSKGAPQRGVINIQALYSPDNESAPQPVECQVVQEDALMLEVEGIGNYTLMWTPTGAMDIAQGYCLEDGVLGDVDEPEGLALALGFALSEGLIKELGDLKSVSVCPDDAGVIKVQLHYPENVQVQRKDVVIDSSCGICGPRDIIQDNVLGLSEVTTTLSLCRNQIPLLMSSMRERQLIFEETGGSHAAAIFDPRGDVIAVAEDLGRHNALDKAIGLALLQRGSVSGCGVVLSSRLSLEMVIKAVRTGLEVMLAVSAPTSLAVDVAKRFGITLCGFVRGSRTTIYSHEDRITD
jgi:FdhD protein